MSSQPWPRSSWGFRLYWAKTSQSSSFACFFFFFLHFFCLFAVVCVEGCWRGSHHGAFAHTGQEQVSFSLSLLFFFFYSSFVCLLVCVCVEGGWQGSHHGAFIYTGQGQVSLPLSVFFCLLVCVERGWRSSPQGDLAVLGKDKSVFLFLSLLLSSSFSLHLFLHFFCLLVCVEGGLHSGPQGGFADTGQGQVFLFLSSSSFLPLFLFVFLSSSCLVPLSAFLFFTLLVCVEGGGVALQWMNCTVKTRIWKSLSLGLYASKTDVALNFAPAILFQPAPGHFFLQCLWLQTWWGMIRENHAQCCVWRLVELLSYVDDYILVLPSWHTIYLNEYM